MDRFTRGFIIGTIATIVKNLLDYFDYTVLHITQQTYANFVGIFILGRKPTTPLEAGFSYFLDIGFNGFMGILLTYYAYRTADKRNLWFKGMIWGIGIFFSVYSLGTLYKIPGLNVIDIGTAISHFVTSSIDGLLMGIGIYLWGKKLGDWDDKEPVPDGKANREFKVSPVPARKPTNSKVVIRRKLKN